MLLMTKMVYALCLRSMPYVFWALMLLVTYLMLIELAPKTGGWPYWDKVQHMAVFAMLTTLACLAYPQKRLWIALGLLSYGAIIEFLQGALTLTRMVSTGDWLADAAGSLLVLASIWLWQNFSNPKRLRTL